MLSLFKKNDLKEVEEKILKPLNLPSLLDFLNQNTQEENNSSEDIDNE